MNKVSSSYNFSFASNPCCLVSPGGGKTQIARGTGFVLYKTNKLVIAIFSTLSNKSIGTSSRTWTNFSYTLHWY
jgi:hypothetical protein